jgi:LPS-assembly protein
VRSADSSDVIASVGGRFLRDWSFDGTVQYSPRDQRTQQLGVQLRYSPEIAKVVNASYRFNRELLRQVDVWTQWPIAAGWYAVGRYNYSFQDARLLEGLGGFEYNGGCWVFRAVAARRQVALQTTSTDFMFQLELNGLGQIGHGSIVSTLERAIPGYRVTNPSDPALAPPGARPGLPFQSTF